MMIFLFKLFIFSISPAGADMLSGSSGYLSEKGGYGGVGVGGVGGVGGVYPSNYGCYYTNMDYLSPGMSHSAINVPVSTNNLVSQYLEVTNGANLQYII